jgi:hypothetical protein
MGRWGDGGPKGEGPSSGAPAAKTTAKTTGAVKKGKKAQPVKKAKQSVKKKLGVVCVYFCVWLFLCVLKYIHIIWRTGMRV